jgi:hypothetical protein
MTLDEFTATTVNAKNGWVHLESGDAMLALDVWDMEDVRRWRTLLTPEQARELIDKLEIALRGVA